MTCPHDNIVHCPLYVAGHDGNLAGYGCVRGEWIDGCFGGRAFDHAAQVERLRMHAPQLVGECEWKARCDQHQRNMRAAGVR